MKEFAQNILMTAAIGLVSRYGVLGDGELVTLNPVPTRGMTISHTEIEGLRCAPEPAALAGFFSITSRSRGKFTLENKISRIVVHDVPRKKIHKIIEWE